MRSKSKITLYNLIHPKIYLDFIIITKRYGSAMGLIFTKSRASLPNNFFFFLLSSSSSNSPPNAITPWKRLCSSSSSFLTLSFNFLIFFQICANFCVSRSIRFPNLDIFTPAPEIDSRVCVFFSKLCVFCVAESRCCHHRLHLKFRLRYVDDFVYD